MIFDADTWVFLIFDFLFFMRCDIFLLFLLFTPFSKHFLYKREKEKFFVYEIVVD